MHSFASNQAQENQQHKVQEIPSLLHKLSYEVENRICYWLPRNQNECHEMVLFPEVCDETNLVIEPSLSTLALMNCKRYALVQ